MHIIVFSHGFGVRKDARGMFTDIAAALAPAISVLFDYNTFDTNNNIRVAPLTDQAQKLQEVIARVQQEHPHATVDLIAHSQGCVVAGLAEPQGIRKILLLAPPETLNIQRITSLFGKREGSVIDLKGTSKLARRDGTLTIVPRAYWTSLNTTPPEQLYNNLAAHTPTTIVIADNDEVLSSSLFPHLGSTVAVRHLAANHDFSGDARSALIALVRQELAQPGI